MHQVLYEIQKKCAMALEQGVHSRDGEIESAGHGPETHPSARDRPDRDRHLATNWGRTLKRMRLPVLEKRTA